MDNPVEIGWIKGEDWVGIFNTEKNEYRIFIKNYGNNIWRYKFYLYQDKKLSVELTGFDYDKFKVLATIDKSFIDFIYESRVKSLY